MPQMIRNLSGFLPKNLRLPAFKRRTAPLARLLACGFFTLVVLILVQGRLDCLAEPRAEFQEANLALSGPIYTGQRASGEFVLFNKGDQDLEIKKVSPG
jgi:hypothetical protein